MCNKESELFFIKISLLGLAETKKSSIFATLLEKGITNPNVISGV